jgi:hypothetical protein
MAENLFIGTSYYQILYTILKLMKSEEKADFLIYFFAGKYRFADIDDVFIENMRNLTVFENIYIQNSKGFETWSIAKKAFWLLFRRKALIELFRPPIENLDAYSRIYHFGDISSRSHYFLLTKTPYHLLEGQKGAFTVSRIAYHGFCVETRRTFMHKLGYLAKKLVLDDFLSFGQAACCKSIEVDSKDGLGIPLDKVEEHPVGLLYSGLSAAQQAEIFDLFLGHDWREKYAFANRSSLILLVPVYTAVFFNSDEALARRVYTAIYEEELRRGNHVVVKPHPGDSTDYSEWFPEATLMKANIPIEIFNITDAIHFDRAVTVFSSSLSGITFADEKIYYDVDYVDQFR